MSRAVRSLLNRAAREAIANGGFAVPVDTQMALAAEGYDLTALDGDVERIVEGLDA